MDKFYIITNRDKDQNLRFTEEIVQYLKEHGKKCQVQQAERKTEGTYHYTDPELIPEGTQCILVLGGDGTLLQAARDVVHREIPLAIWNRFVQHGEIASLRAKIGLSAPEILNAIEEYEEQA